MKTITANIKEGIDQEIITEAGSILKDGGLVAFPTETVYGLGGNALDEQAAEKIYAAKGRPSDNPLIVHIAEFEALNKIAAEIPEEAKMLADAFWPGPLTMIFQKTDLVPMGTTGGLNTVAVRMPDHPVALALIRAAGGYIAAPSANTSGRPSPTCAAHVQEDLDGRIEMILDGGPVGIGLESTIVDLSEGVPTILRPGYINQQMLEEVIGKTEIDRAILSDDSGIKPKAPGMKYRHYAPKASLTIVEGEQEKVTAKINELLKEGEAAGEKIGVIASTETAADYLGGIVRTIGSRSDELSISRHLFGILRDFDTLQVDRIYSESFETPQKGQAIMNRLMKPAAHQVKEVYPMNKYDRLIFVSNSDTCRGPMAEAILKSKFLLSELEVESRGLVVLFPEPVNQKAEAILASHGLTMKDHTAKMLEQEDFDERTLILVMEDALKQRIFQEHENVQNTWQLSEYIKEETDVTEPVGGSLADYGACYELLDCMISSLVVVLNEEELLC